MRINASGWQEDEQPAASLAPIRSSTCGTFLRTKAPTRTSSDGRWCVGPRPSWRAALIGVTPDSGVEGSVPQHPRTARSTRGRRLRRQPRGQNAGGTASRSRHANPKKAQQGRQMARCSFPTASSGIGKCAGRDSRQAATSHNHRGRASPCRVRWRHSRRNWSPIQERGRECHHLDQAGAMDRLVPVPILQIRNVRVQIHRAGKRARGQGGDGSGDRAAGTHRSTSQAGRSPVSG